MRTGSVVGISLVGITAVIGIGANAQMSGGPSHIAPQTDQVADAAGNLHVPDSYRSTYEFLGSWAVAADQGQGSKELHIVYASPGTTAAYRNDGKFPDSTVLVKEVHQAATKEMTTGTVSHAVHPASFRFTVTGNCFGTSHGCAEQPEACSSQPVAYDSLM
jgi:Cytochrome P460